MAETSASWNIVLALQAQLQQITRGNGYLTDAGLNVWTNDGQAGGSDVLGLMIYSDGITSTPDQQPGKPTREIALLVEFIVPSTLDDPQQMAHYVIEDIDACVEAYGKAQKVKPAYQQRPILLQKVDILDRPEGSSLVAGSARVAVGYFR